MNINNILFQSQYFTISVYSLLYLFSFASFFILATYQIKNKKSLCIATMEDFKDIFFILIFSSLLGGRLGHILFYEFEYYKTHIQEMFYISKGGMSFFGAFVFSSFVLYLYSLKYKKSFFCMSDFILLLVPIGLFLGRIGNFINNEIWGKDTYNLLYKIKIYDKGVLEYKTPIVLYEAFFEGFVLFVILQYLLHKRVKNAIITISFLFFYGLFRFVIEFFKFPYYNNEYILKYFTFSQICSAIMIVSSLLVYFYSYKKNKSR